METGESQEYILPRQQREAYSNKQWKRPQGARPCRSAGDGSACAAWPVVTATDRMPDGALCQPDPSASASASASIGKRRAWQHRGATHVAPGFTTNSLFISTGSSPLRPPPGVHACACDWSAPPPFGFSSITCSPPLSSHATQIICACVCVCLCVRASARPHACACASVHVCESVRVCECARVRVCACSPHANMGLGSSKPQHRVSVVDTEEEGCCDKPCCGVCHCLCFCCSTSQKQEACSCLCCES